MGELEGGWRAKLEDVAEKWNKVGAAAFAYLRGTAVPCYPHFAKG